MRGLQNIFNIRLQMVRLAPKKGISEALVFIRLHLILFANGLIVIVRKDFLDLEIEAGH
jgi:hypothetical protein